MSAFGGKADALAYPSACPLIAKSGSGLLGRLVCAKPDVVIGDMHLFRDRVLISDTARLSDDQLVESMAQGDPERERAARLLLGAGDGFPEPEDADTQH